jgi:alkanesulfonate monooxygenase SsuD/methylene tetrahydromethanopterin reductase-like flavin-dependent oxidoreductase (luciferase family)
MTGFLIARDEAELRARAARLGAGPIPPHWISGTPEQVVARLKELEAVGVERVMLQHLLHDDLEAVELTGREVIPEVS